MIGRIIGSGRGIAGMVAYITHDQTSADNRRPTTSERVAWTACLGIPTEDTELMVRAMQGLTADAPALKTLAGISARGRKLKKPYTHLVLSWPEGARAPSQQEMLSAVAEALDSIGLDHRHYAVCAAHTDTARPHVHVAVSRVDPETGRAVNLDQGATKRLSRWAEQYEREHGGIVVPTRVERREAQTARRDLERRCRKGGMPRNQARATAARLHPRPPAKPARKRPPSPDSSTPQDRSQWRGLLERQAEQLQAQRTAEAQRVARRRREWRTYQAARAQAHSTGAAAPTLPRSASIRKLRADGARERIALRRSHRAERVSLARRLGRVAVAVWRQGAAAVRTLFRRPPPKVDLDAERRRLDAELTEARRRRTEQTRERFKRAERDAKFQYDRAYNDWSEERPSNFSRPSDEQRRKARAAGKTVDAAIAAYQRAGARLRRYERAADAVERPRPAYTAPYTPSLEEVVAEVDRRLAQERRERERERPRSETAPARTAPPKPRAPSPAPPARPRPTQDPPPVDGPTIRWGDLPEQPPKAPPPASSGPPLPPAPTRGRGR